MDLKQKTSKNNETMLVTKIEFILFNVQTSVNRVVCSGE